MSDPDKVDPNDFDKPEQLDTYMQEKIGALMDNNHSAMQEFRRSARRIIALRTESDNIFEDIVEALVIGARMINDVTADIITQEWGIDKLPISEDNE